MRHCNKKGYSYYRDVNNTRKCYKPYSRPYTYEKVSKNRKYIQVLDYVASHPNCKRFDIQCAVWNFDPKLNTAYDLRGYMSLVFANLLYDDLIDYNTKFQYTITNRGLALLKIVVNK